MRLAKLCQSDFRKKSVIINFERNLKILTMYFFGVMTKNLTLWSKTGGILSREISKYRVTYLSTSKFEAHLFKIWIP